MNQTTIPTGTLPWALYVRASDGSCYLAEGDYRNGTGQAFDVSCDEKTAQRIVAAMNAEVEAASLRQSHARLLEALRDSEQALEAIPVNPESHYWHYRAGQVKLMRAAIASAQLTQVGKEGTT